jgi:hypothetical protein
MRALVVAAALFFVASADAMACSCPAKSDAERLAAAEAAFVGTLMERRDTSDPSRPYQSSADSFVNVYRVDESYKGGLSGIVEIRTARFDASCGLDFPIGSQQALYPRRYEGGWTGGTCDLGTIEGMRAAGQPIARQQIAPPMPGFKSVCGTKKAKAAKKKKRRKARRRS